MTFQLSNDPPVTSALEIESRPRNLAMTSSTSDSCDEIAGVQKSFSILCRAHIWRSHSEPKDLWNVSGIRGDNFMRFDAWAFVVQRRWTRLDIFLSFLTRLLEESETHCSDDID